MMKKSISTFIRIRNIPVYQLICWRTEKLEKTEQDVFKEISYLKIQLKRANLTLRWIRGIIRIKTNRREHG